jgi:hypothetical protein
MQESLDSQGQEIKQTTIPTIVPTNVAADLERIRDARLKLKRHKGNSLHQTKQLYILPMFLGWNKQHLKKAQEDVDYFTDRIKAQEDGIVFAQKSLDFSANYISLHGDDEDKAAIAEAILKKIEKLKRQQVELMEQYEIQLAKEKK